MKLPVILPVMLLTLAIGSECATPLVQTTNDRQSALRIAVIGLIGAKTTAQSIDSALTQALAFDSRAVLIDRSMIQPALAGIGYDGSINMSKDEARRLGAAIGCDFFIIGKTEVLARSTRENESHEEAYAGVMIVDARNGSLASFDFVLASGSTSAAALSDLVRTVAARAPRYIERAALLMDERAKQSEKDGARIDTEERIEDVPVEGSPGAVGFLPPEFLNRVKPEYTAEAEQADIAATVEALVVFRLNGEVGRVEITRWAGFGLDESADRALRQLKFKPATRDGKPISVRAMIRYNFRRVADPTSKTDEPATKRPEKPTRDLHELLKKPTYRRPS